MIRVRFASGLVLQYNTANHCVRQTSGYTDIFTETDGTWIAQVPTALCVVERYEPCRVYHTSDDREQLRVFAEACEDVTTRGTLDGYMLGRIKKALANFNAVSRRWRA